MKNIFKILPILLVSLGCRAQYPVIDLKQDDGRNAIPDIYLKDMYNVLDPFVGTYLYTNGNTSLKIILEKRTQAYDGYKYEDLLVGEYRYVENGVEKVNTLNDLYNWFDIEQMHSIGANFPLQMGDYLCQGCVANEKRILGGFVDHFTSNHARIIISKTTVGTQQAINLFIYWQTKGVTVGTTFTYPYIPGGDWVLIKQ